MRTPRYTDPTELMNKIREVLADTAPRIYGLTDYSREKIMGDRRDYISLEWKRAFVVEATLYVNTTNCGYDRGLPEGKVAMTCDINVEVNWASTGRAPAAAQAAIALYTEVVNLASLIETIIKEARKIGRVVDDPFVAKAEVK